MAYAGLDVEGMYEVSQKAASAVCKLIQGSSWDDLVQDGIEWMLSHKHKIEEWHNDPTLPDGGMGKTFKSVFHHMLDVVAREKAERAGYRPEDNFYYSTGMIKRMLPLFYEDKRAELEGLAEELNLPDRDAYLDLERALKLVRPDVRNKLKWLFSGDQDLNLVYDEISMADGISFEAARKRIYRVIRQLQAALGGERPINDFEGRKAISNSAARSAASRVYGD